MENVSRFFRNEPVIGQPPQRFLKALALVAVNGMMRGNQLGHQLGELAQLDDGRRGIVTEIAFREPS